MKLLNTLFEKNKLKKDKITEIKKEDKKSFLKINHIYSNDYCRIIAESCSICWNRIAPKEIEKQITYIYKRIETGHTSILEHSNIIFLAEFESDSLYLHKELNEFMSNGKFLNFCIKEDNNKTFVLIGGSLRAYFDVMNKLLTRNKKKNSFLSLIITNFYSCSYREFFKEYIDNYLIEDLFYSTEDIQKIHKRIDNYCYENDYFKITGYDPASRIMAKLSWFTNRKTVFLESDIIKFTSITVLFKNISRTATHQLVRHRNAITQESQRYVDYSNAKFISPDLYSENTVKDHKYYLENVCEYFPPMTLNEIGNLLCNIYKSLLNDKEAPLKKEDARAFLPSNIASNLYMTFSIYNLFKFFELRTHISTQAEIRKYATELQNVYATLDNAISYDTYYLQPEYIKENTSSYDEVDEVLEESVIEDEE